MMQFTNGMMMMAFCVAGVLFLRYFRTTRDRLFLMFSIAFWIMAINRLAMAFFIQGVAENERDYKLYIVRLLAFVVILVAIVDKNRKKSSSPPRLT